MPGREHRQHRGHRAGGPGSGLAHRPRHPRQARQHLRAGRAHPAVARASGEPVIASMLSSGGSTSFMNGPQLWFANRGTGFVLLLLLTLATTLGVLSTSRMSPRRWPRMLTQGLHRNVSMLAVTFLAAH